MFSCRTWLLVIGTMQGYWVLLVAVKHMQNRLYNYVEPPSPVPPVNTDTFTTQFSEFGVKEYVFNGEWNGEIYRATIWLRIQCDQNPSHRTARMVVTLNRAPTTKVDVKRYHAVTPKTFFHQRGLPDIFFLQSPTNNADRAMKVLAEQQYWEQFVTGEWLDSAYVGKAVLRADAHYTLGMEGSEWVFKIPPFRCVAPSPLFKKGDVWMGMVENVVKRRQPGTFRFLVLQHLQWHLKLGFRGMLMVVTPETSALLLNDSGIVDVVNKKQLVLVPWEFGLIDDLSLVMQVPGNNLLKMIMGGSDAMLAVWDLDEYLVLPRKRPISYEVTEGCMKQLQDPEEHEQVISFTWTYDKTATQPEVARWLSAGGVLNATRIYNYTATPYSHCNFGVLCKAIINPNTDFNMHVHQLARPPPHSEHRSPSPRDCAYMHHFFQLFVRRPIWDEHAVGEPDVLRRADLPA